MSTTFAVGDKVIINPEWAPAALRGVVFEVKKVNPKNVVAHPVNGSGRGISYPPHTLEKFTGASTADVTSIPFVPTTLFDEGEVVTLARAYKDVTTETPLVVTRDGGNKTVNVVRVGGEGGRYLRIPRAGLVKRDLAWLKGAL